MIRSFFHNGSVVIHDFLFGDGGAGAGGRIRVARKMEKHRKGKRKTRTIGNYS